MHVPPSAVKVEVLPSYPIACSMVSLQHGARTLQVQPQGAHNSVCSGSIHAQFRVHSHLNASHLLFWAQHAALRKMHSRWGPAQSRFRECSALSLQNLSHSFLSLLTLVVGSLFSQRVSFFMLTCSSGSEIVGMRQVDPNGSVAAGPHGRVAVSM